MDICIYIVLYEYKERVYYIKKRKKKKHKLI